MLYVCMHGTVCMYGNHVCMYVRMCVYEGIIVCTSLNIHTYIALCTLYICVCGTMYVCVYIQACTIKKHACQGYVYIHTYIHDYIHTYIGIPLYNMCVGIYVCMYV